MKIHKALVQIFTEDSPFYAAVKKWAMEFKRDMDSSKDDAWS